MNNKIEYAQPTEEQLKLLQGYANICTEAINMLSKCEDSISLQHAAARLQESMGWMNSYVISGGKLKELNEKDAMN